MRDLLSAWDVDGCEDVIACVVCEAAVAVRAGGEAGLSVVVVVAAVVAVVVVVVAAIKVAGIRKP